MNDFYLRPGLPRPEPNGLDLPFWEGLQNEKLMIQKCKRCDRFQWGPEWICHRCNNFDLVFQEVKAEGYVYSYQRIWHPVHKALADQGPYVVCLITLPHADNIRLVGNLLGDPEDEVTIGALVEGVYEHHESEEARFSLLQWAMV